MSFDSILNREVTITNPTLPGGVTRYGDPTESASVPITEAARVEPLSTREDLQGRDTVITRFRVFLKAPSALTALSTVTFQGVKYRVQGDPLVLDALKGQHHIVATLERLAG